MSLEYQYIDEMQKIHKNLLYFLENEEDNEEIFTNILDFQILDNQHKLKSLLHLLSNIESNYHREFNFFDKIEKILIILKKKILKYFTNSEIFSIFHYNKRILLFLIEKGIIIMDNYMISAISKQKYVEFKYLQYFAPEIQSLINSDWISQHKSLVDEINKKIPENHSELRKKGENDSYLCQLIQKDSIDDFIIYVNQENIALNSSIVPSIYETNLILLKNQNVKLIEYATFFGSIQIFNYLRVNGIELNSSLWIYAIHSKNAEIINILEENNIDKTSNYILESIKCHHNRITHYFLNNYLQNDENLHSILIESIKRYNFSFIQNKDINIKLFPYFCKYDYYILVDNFLRGNKIDLNQITIDEIL